MRSGRLDCRMTRVNHVNSAARGSQRLSAWASCRCLAGSAGLDCHRDWWPRRFRPQLPLFPCSGWTIRVGFPDSRTTPSWLATLISATLARGKSDGRETLVRYLNHLDCCVVLRSFRFPLAAVFRRGGRVGDHNRPEGDGGLIRLPDRTQPVRSRTQPLDGDRQGCRPVFRLESGHAIRPRGRLVTGPQRNVRIRGLRRCKPAQRAANHESQKHLCYSISFHISFNKVARNSLRSTPPRLLLSASLTKPPASHMRATYKPFAWEGVATPMRPSSHPHATLKPRTSHPQASLRRDNKVESPRFRLFVTQRTSRPAI